MRFRLIAHDIAVFIYNLLRRVCNLINPSFRNTPAHYFDQCMLG